MKKILILLLCLLLTASITGCGTQSIKPIDTIEGNMKTYSEMSDGTWQCDGHIYKYRLEISGRLSNAVKDSTYIYLSNIEDITFEQAWKASGLSSNMDDYFDIDEAVLVELPDCQLSGCWIVKAEPYARCRRKTPLGLRAKRLSRSRVQPLPS